MAQLPDSVLFDKRLIERHIRNGSITRKEYEARLKQVEDQEAQAEWSSLEALNESDGEFSNSGKRAVPTQSE